MHVKITYWSTWKIELKYLTDCNMTGKNVHLMKCTVFNSLRHRL